MSIYDKMGQKAPTGVARRKQVSEKTRILRHEEDLAEQLSGEAQPNSGATLGKKGDIKLEKFLLDSKETAGQSITVQGAMLTKITREAREIGKFPGLVITLDKLPSTVDHSWAIIPLDVFSELLEQVENAAC